MIEACVCTGGVIVKPSGRSTNNRWHVVCRVCGRCLSGTHGSEWAAIAAHNALSCLVAAAVKYRKHLDENWGHPPYSVTAEFKAAVDAFKGRA